MGGWLGGVGGGFTGVLWQADTARIAAIEVHFLIERAAMSGVLYVVATPIGNLDDITRRAVKVLGSVRMIAAEDTRRTQVLLAEIDARWAELVALHTHNERSAGARVMAVLLDGADVALVTDAGTPLLSDPGFELVRRCWEEGVSVVPVPGASAVAAALSVCPLAAHNFHFEGFLPAKESQRRARLQEMARMTDALVLFEAPHRIAACLNDLDSIMGQRRVMVAREMTKRHESYYCDLPAVLARTLESAAQLRGEFVLVVEAARSGPVNLDAARTMEVLGAELPPAQAARIGARLLGLGRAELYRLVSGLRDGD